MVEVITCAACNETKPVIAALTYQTPYGERVVCYDCEAGIREATKSDQDGRIWGWNPTWIGLGPSPNRRKPDRVLKRGIDGQNETVPATLLAELDNIAREKRADNLPGLRWRYVNRAVSSASEAMNRFV